MNLKTVKNAKEVTLDGISVELEKTDQSITMVTLRDGKGNTLIVRKTDWSFAVLVPAPPVMVKRFRIEGKLHGIPFKEDFESKRGAANRLGELGATNRLELSREECPITEVEVPESEAAS